MLITMLKGLRQNAPAPRVRPQPSNRPQVSVVDISGPLPEKAAAAPLPFLDPSATSTRRAAAVRRDPKPSLASSPMSDLPPELDPFEADFPWIGWVEPKHESVVRSSFRSPTYEQDLQRVLAIFAA